MNNSNDYNNEPVFYCKNCLSLKIKTIVSGLDLDYCDECGCTDIEEASLEVWQNLYRNKYGFDYLTKELKK